MKTTDGRINRLQITKTIDQATCFGDGLHSSISKPLSNYFETNEQIAAKYKQRPGDFLRYRGIAWERLVVIAKWLKMPEPEKPRRFIRCPCCKEKFLYENKHVFVEGSPFRA